MSELTQKTIYEHAEALRKKEYSSVQLTQAYLDRIAAKDKTIGAYITVTAEKALEKAKAFDEGKSANNKRSLLAGIPCGSSRYRLPRLCIPTRIYACAQTH